MANTSTIIQKNQQQQTTADLTFYWQYYDLTRDPFAAVPDNTMTLLLPKWEHHLDLIQHLLSSDNVLIAIIGRKGIGKSTLLHLFNAQISNEFWFNHITGSHNFDLNKLIAFLEDAFKLPIQNSDTIEEKLDALISDIQYQERTCVLAIDNAEDLPEETLQALLYLIKQQSTNQMRFHVLLFGNGELQTKLNDFAKQELTGDLIHSIELEALNLEETQQYVQHRLLRAGLQSPFPFDTKTIQHIYKLSQGIPESINRFAQQILLDNLTKQNRSLFLSFGRKHQTKLLGGSLIIIALLLVAMILLHYNKNAQTVSTAESPQPLIKFADQSQTVAAPKAKPVATLSMRQQAQAQPQQPRQPSSQASLPAAPQLSKTQQNTLVDSKGSKTMISHANSALSSNSQKNRVSSKAASIPTPKPASAVITSAAIKRVQKEPQKKSRSAVDQSMNVDQPMNTMTIPKSAPVMTGLMVTAVNNNSNNKATNNHAASEKQPKQTAQRKAKIPLQQVAHGSTLKLVSADAELRQIPQTWLQKDNRHYTLQVLALSKKADLLTFVDKFGLQKNTYYFHTIVHGQSLYALIYGNFPNEVQAIKAKKMLPKSIQRYKVWVRSFASIKEAIESSKRLV